MSDAAARIS